jgi:FkbM family methyltransferase
MPNLQRVHDYFLPEDEAHFQEYLADGEYQSFQRNAGVEVCRALGSPFRYAIDIGANVGLWAKPLAAVFKKVICFEALPSNFECLEKNMEGLSCELFPYGLSDEEGEQVLWEPADRRNCGAPSFCDMGADALPHLVPVKRLDDFAFSDIDFVKIDVQGWELKVLQGAEQTLRRQQPVILCENHPEQEAIRTFLAGLSYARILRVQKEEIFVPMALLTQEMRGRIARHFMALAPVKGPE